MGHRDADNAERSGRKAGRHAWARGAGATALWGPCPRTKRKTESGKGRLPGLTLVELMVSVAVLSVMILIVNMLLLSSRDAVGMVQQTIRANSDARGAASRLRDDLTRLTRDGYLAILAGDPASDPDTPVWSGWPGTHALLFTAVGPFRSAYVGDSMTANAARIDYGVCQTSPGNQRVLFRRAILLTTDPTNARMGRNSQSPRPYDYDYEPIPLDGQAAQAVQVGPAQWSHRYWLAPKFLQPYDWPPGSRVIYPPMALPAGLSSGSGRVTLAPMVLPPYTPAQVNRLWPYLAGNCRKFAVHWTTDDGSYNWYGVDHPRDNAWHQRDAAYQDQNPSAYAPEFNLSGAGGSPAVYCALWTSRNKNTWPTGLRVTFELVDPNHAYEVTVDLAR